MPMKLVDLRLPDEAIALLDALKDRHPHINSRPSRTSVILTLLCEMPAQSPRETMLQDSLRAWIDTQGIGQSIT